MLGNKSSLVAKTCKALLLAMCVAGAGYMQAVTLEEIESDNNKVQEVSKPEENSNIDAPMHTTHKNGFADLKIKFNSDYNNDLKRVNQKSLSNTDKHLNEKLLQTTRNYFSFEPLLITKPDVMENLLSNPNIFDGLFPIDSDAIKNDTNKKIYNNDESRKTFYTILKDMIFTTDTTNGGKTTKFETWYKKNYAKFKNNSRAKKMIKMIYLSILKDFIINNSLSAISTLWHSLPNSKTRKIIDIFNRIHNPQEANQFSVDFRGIFNVIQNFENNPQSTTLDCSDPTISNVSESDLSLFFWLVPVLLTQRNVNEIHRVDLSGLGIKQLPRGLKYLPEVTDVDMRFSGISSLDLSSFPHIKNVNVTDSNYMSPVHLLCRSGQTVTGVGSNWVRYGDNLFWSLRNTWNLATYRIVHAYMEYVHYPITRFCDVTRKVVWGKPANAISQTFRDLLHMVKPKKLPENELLAND